MDEDYNVVYGIDKLAELLIEREIKFYVKDEVSLAFQDDVGNWHECWMAGADENFINALIVVTPEQLLSVPDLNGIITENEKLRELVYDMWDVALHPHLFSDGSYLLRRMCDLGIEVDDV